MNVSLYQAAAALDATSDWQDVMAENLASSSVPGFRKQAMVTEAVQAGLMPNSGSAPQFFSIPKSRSVTSFQPGQTNYTGDNRTVALDGPGFFQVKLANGAVAVTRDGEFQMNAKGLLVSKEGYTVLGDSGAPIQLDPQSHDPISISRSGQVVQGTETKGKLGLTDFENPGLLTPTNGVYFFTDNPQLKTKASTAGLRDGFV